MVASLAGGADFLFRQGAGGGAAVAVRICGAAAMEAAERRWATEAEMEEGPEGWLGPLRGEGGGSGGDGSGSGIGIGGGIGSGSGIGIGIGSDWAAEVEALRAFRDAYFHTVVFFVLPPGDARRRQLARPSSFLQVAQRALSSSSSSSSSSSISGSSKGGSKGRGRAAGSSRIFLVPDVQSQRSHLRAVLDSVTAEKREGRARFFAEQGRRNLLPPPPPAAGPGRGWQ